MNPSRLARALVALFPPSFREEYGSDLVHLFAEQWTGSGVGLRRRAGLILDLLTSAAREWKSELAAPGGAQRRRLDVLILDLKHQLRWLARTPAFAGSALLTLALGVGIATAIFAVFYGVLLQPLPFREPDRLAFITRSGDVSISDGVDWRARSRSWESIGLFARNWGVDFTGEGDPEKIAIYAAEPDFFRVLGVNPVLGRLFGAEDNRTGGPPLIVLTEGFWRSRFGADSSIIGRALTLNGNPTTVIGVVSRSADFIDDEIGGFVPFAVHAPTQVPERGTNNLDAIGRVRQGVPFEQARRELTAISTDLTREYPRTNRNKIVDPLPLVSFITGGVRPALMVTLSAVVALLLIATVNLAGLLVARVTARRRELAVRSALGAGPGRITRQLVTEGLVLGGLGGSAGLLVAWVALGFLRSALPGSVPRTAALELTGPVLAFGVALTIASGLLCGLIPAFSGRGSVGTGDLGSTRGSSERGRQRALRSVVAVEVALAVALLVAAGVVVKSFDRLWNQPLGFDPEGVLAVDLALPEGRFGTIQRQTRAYTAVVDALRASPGILGAAYVTTLPLHLPGGIGNTVLLEGRETPANGPTGARIRPVYGDYFATMRIAVTAGRPLTDGDKEGTEPVAVVNRTFARAFFRELDPIGQRIALRDWHELTPGPVWMTIVGVADDIKALTMAMGDEPAIYMPYRQRQVSWQAFGSLVIRTTGDPAGYVPAVKQAVRDVDGSLVPKDFETLTARRSGSVARERFLAQVLALFAVSAVLLVVQGLWGVVAYSVAERRREIGVRVALGAARHDVVGLVTREAILPMALGAIAGTGIALAGSGLLRRALFEVSPTDPVVLAATVVGLTVVALLASALPAWRATRIDPLEAMRAE